MFQLSCCKCLEVIDFHWSQSKESCCLQWALNKTCNLAVVWRSKKPKHRGFKLMWNTNVGIKMEERNGKFKMMLDLYSYVKIQKTGLHDMPESVSIAINNISLFLCTPLSACLNTSVVSCLFVLYTTGSSSMIRTPRHYDGSNNKYK